MAHGLTSKAPVKGEEFEVQASPVQTPAEKHPQTQPTPDTTSSDIELGDGATQEIPLSSTPSDGVDIERSVKPVTTRSARSGLQISPAPTPPSSPSSSTFAGSSSSSSSTGPSTPTEPSPPPSMEYATKMSVKDKLSEKAMAIVPVKALMKKAPAKPEKPLKQPTKTIAFTTTKKKPVPSKALNPKNGDTGPTAGPSCHPSQKTVVRPEAPAPSPAASSHSPSRTSTAHAVQDTSMAVDAPPPTSLSTTLALPSNSAFVSLPSSSTRTSAPMSAITPGRAAPAGTSGASIASRVSNNMSSTANSSPSVNHPAPTPAATSTDTAAPQTPTFRMLPPRMQPPVTAAVVASPFDAPSTSRFAASSSDSPAPAAASTSSRTTSSIVTSTSSSSAAKMSSPPPPKSSSSAAKPSPQPCVIPNKTPARQDKGKGKEIHRDTQTSEDVDMGPAPVKTSGTSTLAQLAEVTAQLGEIHVDTEDATEDRKKSTSTSKQSPSNVMRRRVSVSMQQVREYESDSEDEGMVEVDTSSAVPAVQVAPPQDEVMSDGTAQEMPKAPAAPKTPEGISIRGAAKKQSSSTNAKTETKESKVAQPRVVQPSETVPTMALPKLNVQVPAPPSQLASTSASNTTASSSASTDDIGTSATTASRISDVPSATALANSSSAFGLRQRDTSTVNSSPARTQASVPTSTEASQVQTTSSSQATSSTLPTQPTVPSAEHTVPSSFFGIRPFSSFVTPSPATGSSLLGDDAMELDEVPVVPTPAVPAVPSLLSRISISPSQAPSLASAPPLGSWSNTTQGANSLLASAPPLGSGPAFSFNTPPEQQDADMVSLASASSLRTTFGITPQSTMWGNWGNLATSAGSTNWGSWAGKSATNKWGAWGSSSTKAETNAWGNWGTSTSSTTWGNWANPTPNTGSTYWGNWGRQQAVTDATSQPTTAQACTCQQREQSPLDPANSFWASATANTGRNVTPLVPEHSKVAEKATSSDSESGYDSDGSTSSSVSDWWETVSDSEDHVYRSIRRNGVLSIPKNRPAYMRGQRLARPGRPASAPASPSPRFAAITTLSGLKRDRDESDESDSSGDEDGEMKRQRRYTTPGDASVREQFRKSLRASTRRRARAVSSASLTSLRSWTPIASPTRSLKSLPKPSE